MFDACASTPAVRKATYMTCTCMQCCQMTCRCSVCKARCMSCTCMQMLTSSRDMMQSEALQSTYIGRNHSLGFQCCSCDAGFLSSKKRARHMKSPFDESQTEYVKIPSAVKRPCAGVMTDRQKEVLARQKAGKSASSLT